MSNEGNIYNEVQATLLNSECSPEYAVERAVYALVRFAASEGVGLDRVRDFILEAVHDGQQKGLF